MHAVGLHSALAIKRQRKRWDEQRRARERRYSTQSGESGLTSPRASTGSLDHHPSRHHKANNVNRAAGQGMLDTKVVTSVGMLHIGVVFLVLGAFLLMSGLLPGDSSQWSGASKQSSPATGLAAINWWNELVAIGLFSIIVGVFLIILNRIIAKKEESDLEEYVQRQLTRSKSGHRLERDLETGGLTTRHARKAKQQLKQLTSLDSIDSQDEKISSGSPLDSPPPAYSPMSGIAKGHNNHPDQQNLQSPLFLEQITEEEIISDRIETSTTNSLSPGSPSETRELLQKPRYSKQNGNHNPHLQQIHQPLYVSRI